MYTYILMKKHRTRSLSLCIHIYIYTYAHIRKPVRNIRNPTLLNWAAFSRCAHKKILLAGSRQAALKNWTLITKPPSHIKVLPQPVLQLLIAVVGQVCEGPATSIDLGHVELIRCDQRVARVNVAGSGSLDFSPTPSEYVYTYI